MNIPNMTVAVQTALSLSPDGIAGTQTWTAIYTHILDVPPALVTLSTTDMIEAVQSSLKLTADGIAGTQTWTAVYGALVAPPTSGVLPPGILLIDINHYNAPLDLARCWADGVRIIWHKGTQGASFQDPLYAARKKAALAAGFKWGIYHFSSGAPVGEQLDNFFSVEDGSDATIAYALDWEHSTDGTSDMTAANAALFMSGVRNKTGDYGWVYGSDLPREKVSQSIADPVLSQTKLWLADFGTPVGKMPPTWPNGYDLLQYKQANYAGISGCDLNTPSIPAADFLAGWPFRMAS